MTKKAKVYTAAAGLWGLFIFWNSMQSGETSTKLSDAVVLRMPSWLAWMDFNALTVLVRKSAHFCEYALLAVLVCLAFSYAGQLRWRNAGNILFPCLLWAEADEFLQTFVEGRTGLVRDVAIDFAGVLTGCAVLLAVQWLWRRSRKRTRGAVHR